MVSILLQAVSPQDWRDFAHTYAPSTCNGSVPSFMAVASCWIVSLRLTWSADWVVLIPGAFVSAKIIVMIEISDVFEFWSMKPNQSIPFLSHLRDWAMAEQTRSANLCRRSDSGMASVERLGQVVNFCTVSFITLINLVNWDAMHRLPTSHSPFSVSPAVSKLTRDPLRTQKILRYSDHLRSQIDSAPLSGAR